MRRYKIAIIGTGFVGHVHLEALRQVEFVDVAAITDKDTSSAEALGNRFGIPCVNAAEILRNSEIDAVHICTPNALHFAQVKEALLAGKHVVCEKPLATTVEEAAELVALAARRKLRNCVGYTLRYYPMVQQMRRMREDDDLGEVLVVQGAYTQDWLLRDTDWNWRIDSKSGGPSRAMADIGSHWFDMAEYLTGLRVSSVCADLQTFHKTRMRPNRAAETFANTMAAVENYIATPVDTEDFGAVVFRLGDRARGSMVASQVSAGRKNRLNIEVYGTKAGVAWDGERPNELWIGHRDTGNQILVKDPSLLKPQARTYASLPGGHCEGYGDTFKQVFRRFYASIESHDTEVEYPQFEDGLRQMVVLMAEMESNQLGAWIEVPEVCLKDAFSMTH